MRALLVAVSMIKTELKACLKNYQTILENANSYDLTYEQFESILKVCITFLSHSIDNPSLRLSEPSNAKETSHGVPRKLGSLCPKFLQCIEEKVE